MYPRDTISEILVFSTIIVSLYTRVDAIYCMQSELRALLTGVTQSPRASAGSRVPLTAGGLGRWGGATRSTGGRAARQTNRWGWVWVCGGKRNSRRGSLMSAGVQALTSWSPAQVLLCVTSCTLLSSGSCPQAAVCLAYLSVTHLPVLCLLSSGRPVPEAAV